MQRRDLPAGPPVDDMLDFVVVFPINGMVDARNTHEDRIILAFAIRLPEHDCDRAICASMMRF